MCIKKIWLWGVWILWGTMVYCVQAQLPDTLSTVTLPMVNITAESLEAKPVKPQPLMRINEEYLETRFSANLMKTLESLPGVHAMPIGAGFAKPNIRGMGFQRVSVVHHNLKQEGQQWGADHGLEIDAWDVRNVSIQKGPSSLSYGSDALGGVVMINPPNIPLENEYGVELNSLFHSVNAAWGGSIMFHVKHNRWYSQIRYSEKHMGDYALPADTLIYLTQVLPIPNRQLKNTAGIERNAAWFSAFQNGRYQAQYSISNVYQKMGAFPGAHGIPDVSRVQDDGKRFNIELPYSWVNHFMLSSMQQYAFDTWIAKMTLGYQNNHREEWSLFHTHYNQPQPKENPNRELLFHLHTLSADLKVQFVSSSLFSHAMGINTQFQDNTIHGGYSFLLPEYRRVAAGGYWTFQSVFSSQWRAEGGVRYDLGGMSIAPYTDNYLYGYLLQQGYGERDARGYSERCKGFDGSFHDVSFSLGTVWQKGSQSLSANIGRSFRLPSAQELATNGVHHGSFRHEKGDRNLHSERGWGLDMAYRYEKGDVFLEISPYVHWYENYIYLQPSGQWSMLPHAGQIYEFMETEALLGGVEWVATVPLSSCVSYVFSGESMFSHNFRDGLALSYTPPIRFVQTLNMEVGEWKVFAEYRWILAQNQVARNEKKTDGAHLFNIGVRYEMNLWKQPLVLQCAIENIFNTPFYHHLSYYKQIGLPEAGRNIQLIIKVPIKIKKQ